MKVIADNFLANVEIQLASKGWSRSEFARQLGKTPAYVTQILNGAHTPGLKVVEEWARVLGMEPWTLLKKPKKVSRSA